jgi:hypothetical protein
VIYKPEEVLSTKWNVNCKKKKVTKKKKVIIVVILVYKSQHHLGIYMYKLYNINH